MKPYDYDEAEVHRQFDDAIKRESTHAGPKVGLEAIERLAAINGYRPSAIPVGAAVAASKGIVTGFDLNSAIPIYFQQGMPRREFAGPAVGNAFLFPMNAQSLFVSLGGAGKTTTIVALAAHIAAGKSWSTDDLKRRRILGFFVEESQDELNRKFGAAVHEWEDDDRDRAIENLRLISLLTRDPRLTRLDGRRFVGTGLAEEIILTARAFGAEVIFLDHLQGFAGGDLNNSDTATAIALETNKIVAKTGAAVVMTAHTNKGNIAAQDVLDGFTTGSLAFENAARQVTGIIPLPDQDADDLKVEKTRNEYLLLGMPKNSYGPSRSRAYLHKLYVPDFHTITVEPYAPIGSQKIFPPKTRLANAIDAYVKNNPGTSQNKLDGLSGKAGPFKASKQAVRDAVKEMLHEGELTLRSPTEEERKAHRIPHQVKEVLDVR